MFVMRSSVAGMDFSGWTLAAVIVSSPVLSLMYSYSSVEILAFSL